jgi:hypothetical protein
MGRRQIAGRAWSDARPIAVTVWLTGLCVAQAATAPAFAETKKLPPALTFHVDLLKEPGSTENHGRDLTRPSTATKMEFAGLPVTFGERVAEIDRGPGVEAGFYADYDAELGDAIRLTTHAAITKTKYLDDGWGTDAAAVSAAWRYGNDDVALTLEPTWRVTVVETEIAARDYGANLQLDGRLAKGLSITGDMRYGYHDAAISGDDQYSAGARLGLSHRFGTHANVSVAFDANYTLSRENGRRIADLSDLDASASSIGPVVTMAFPLSEELDFAATFRYCRSTDELPRFSDGARDSEDRQHFDMRLAWHNADPVLRAIDISAGYVFDRSDATAPDEDTLAHALTVALAMTF